MFTDLLDEGIFSIHECGVILCWNRMRVCMVSCLKLELELVGLTYLRLIGVCSWTM
jgi:hypothetical protein